MAAKTVFMSVSVSSEDFYTEKDWIVVNTEQDTTDKCTVKLNKFRILKTFEETYYLKTFKLTNLFFLSW